MTKFTLLSRKRAHIARTLANKNHGFAPILIPNTPYVIFFIFFILFAGGGPKGPKSKKKLKVSKNDFN